MAHAWLKQFLALRCLIRPCRKVVSDNMLPLICDWAMSQLCVEQSAAPKCMFVLHDSDLSVTACCTQRPSELWQTCCGLSVTVCSTQRVW